MPWVSSRSSCERQRQRPARLAHERAAPPGSAGSLDSSSPRDMAIDTSRCCVPSCRSRSIRRRSASVASTRRARDASARRAGREARPAAARSQARAPPRRKRTRTSPELCSSAGSCNSIAIGARRVRRTSSTAPDRGGQLDRAAVPVTYRASAGNQYASSSDGSPSAVASAARRSPGSVGPPSWTTSPATLARASRRRTNVATIAIGTVAIVEEHRFRRS